MRNLETDRLYYLYRCRSCGRLITKLEILKARAHRKVQLCPCGGKTVSPTNAKSWEELFLPRCWKLAVMMWLGKIAPPPPLLSGAEQREIDRKTSIASREFQKKLSEARQKGTT